MDEPVDTSGIAPNPIHPPIFGQPTPAGSPVFDAKIADKPKAPAEPVPDTKEQHIEAIRWLISELTAGADVLTKHKLDQISTRLDAIEDKPTEKTVKW